MTTYPARLLATIAALTLAIQGPAKAQTNSTPPTYFACYIPLVGVVYRIKEQGLPTACVSKSHVEFNWNQAGPKGDQGERGEQGPPGNLALAGQGCPTGFFVSSFSSTGSVVCRNLQGEGPSDPPPPPPPGGHALDGNWTLSPRLTMNCGLFDAVTITVSGTSTQVTAPGVIRFNVRGSGNNGFFELPFDVPLDETDNSFAGTATAQTEGGTFTTTFHGQFTTTSSFTASVQMGGRAAIPFGECRSISETVTGTRIG